ncbi:MAG TPA: AraC family transcriptional regulator [Methylomirabilota bacterium]|nr:AraC family transcriptional regulator [Methylomirabilota bacterium]
MRLDEAVGSWLPGGLWMWAVLAAVVVVAVVAAVVRERQHQRRRRDLQARLADLERILVGISLAHPPPSDGRDDGCDSRSTEPTDALPRGPLSTAISMLHGNLGTGLPGPDRTDLRATFYVYDHIGEPLTPSDVAEGLNLSLRSLQRGLAGSLKCTPTELILAVKMREAKRFLGEEELRVQEAARAVGFDDPFHFSRRFKAYYGIAPSELGRRRDRSVA